MASRPLPYPQERRGPHCDGRLLLEWRLRDSTVKFGVIEADRFIIDQDIERTKPTLHVLKEKVPRGTQDPVTPVKSIEVDWVRSAWR